METKTVKPKIKTLPSEPEPMLQPKPKSWLWLLLLAAIGIFAAINWDDYVVEKDGKLELTPKRKAKLEKSWSKLTMRFNMR